MVRDHPTDIDARIGLATALTRRGAWEDALAILRDVERVAGENADAFQASAFNHSAISPSLESITYDRGDAKLCKTS